MQISNDAYLAVECLVQLRSCTRERPGKTLWLARAINRSVSYTEAIMSRLRRGEFVEAKKGSGGGYYLSRPAETMTVEQVFQAFDQPSTPERLAAGPRRSGNGESLDEGLNGQGSAATAAALGGHGFWPGTGSNGANGSAHGRSTNGNGHVANGNGARGSNGNGAATAVVTGSNQLWEDLRQYVLMVLAGVTIADVANGDARARSILAPRPRPRPDRADAHANPCHPCAPHPCSPCQPCRPA